MRYTGYRTTGYYSGGFPKGVKYLLLINIGLFLLYFFLARTELRGIFNIFALSPRAIFDYFAVWQLFTYMFLHDPFGFGHILFNMLALFMFGTDLERDWGTKRFLNYYFVCGVGAGICDILFNAMFGSLNVRTIGASGAIYGLLLAFGLLYPNRTVMFSFLFPIPAKYFVLIIGGIAFLSAFGSNSRVSHIAHLGGMLWGFLFLKFKFRGFDWDFSLGSLRQRYQDWRVQRAKRRFQVYLKKHQERNRFQ